MNIQQLDTLKKNFENLLKSFPGSSFKDIKLQIESVHRALDVYKNDINQDGEIPEEVANQVVEIFQKMKRIAAEENKLAQFNMKTGLNDKKTEQESLVFQVFEKIILMHNAAELIHKTEQDRKSHENKLIEAREVLNNTKSYMQDVCEQRKYDFSKEAWELHYTLGTEWSQYKDYKHERKIGGQNRRSTNLSYEYEHNLAYTSEALIGYIRSETNPFACSISRMSHLNTIRKDLLTFQKTFSECEKTVPQYLIAQHLFHPDRVNEEIKALWTEWVKEMRECIIELQPFVNEYHALTMDKHMDSAMDHRKQVGYDLHTAFKREFYTLLQKLHINIKKLDIPIIDLDELKTEIKVLNMQLNEDKKEELQAELAANNSKANLHYQHNLSVQKEVESSAEVTLPKIEVVLNLLDKLELENINQQFYELTEQIRIEYKHVLDEMESLDNLGDQKERFKRKVLELITLKAGKLAYLGSPTQADAHQNLRCLAIDIKHDIPQIPLSVQLLKKHDDLTKEELTNLVDMVIDANFGKAVNAKSDLFKISEQEVVEFAMILRAVPDYQDLYTEFTNSMPSTIQKSVDKLNNANEEQKFGKPITNQTQMFIESEGMTFDDYIHVAEKRVIEFEKNVKNNALRI